MPGAAYSREAEGGSAMLKGLILGVVLAIAVAIIGAYGLIRSGLIPANADAAPSSLETWMAGASLAATLAREAPKDQNPVPLSDQNLLDGIALFARNCAICHGSAKGDASPSPIAKGLYQKPPQFATNGVEDDPEGVSFWKIKHGIRLTGMPSFAATLSDREIWTIALFLKHMDKLPPAAEQAWQQVQNIPAAPASR
jgi:mono/diheme cytochrome c family protein